MNKFQISTPGGYEVEVSANTEAEALEKARASWETMPRIIAKNGDTRIFERQNGTRYLVSPGYSTTDPSKIAEAIEGSTGGDLSRQSIDDAVIAENKGLSRLNEIVRGTPFIGSRSDEAMGAMFGPNAAAGARAMTGAMQRQKPLETLALNVAGGIATTAGAGALAPDKLARVGQAVAGNGNRVTQILRSMFGGALAGSAEGAVYGSGEGTDAASRSQEAASGAKFGAIGGGVVGAATPIVAEAASNVVGLFRRSDLQKISAELGISKDAAKVIKAAFEAGGGIEDAVSQVRRAGELGMLADAGPAAQALLDASATAGLAPARTVATAMGDRSRAAATKLDDALFDAMGFPTDPMALQNSIRTGSQTARGKAYDMAYADEIDWRSPAGQELRALIETTPPDVLAGAARMKAMRARKSAFPDYSAEFAPDVRTVSNAATQEADEVSQFFAEYSKLLSQAGRKRPLTAMLKSAGGIDPSGPAGIELKARGVSPQTHPGLFRRGGLKDLDTLESDIMPDATRFDGANDGYSYADPEQLYQGLVDEGRGVATASTDDALTASRIAEMEQVMPEYEARRAAISGAPVLPTAPDAPVETYAARTVEDVDLIKRYLDNIKRTEGAGLLGGTTPVGKDAGDRARDVRNALVEASPNYGTALETAADPISRIEAVKFGAEAMRSGTTRYEVAEFMANATGGEKLALRDGVRGQIDEVMANVRSIPSNPNIDVREAIKAVNDLTNRASTEKLRMILGDGADKFISELAQVSETFNLRAATAANSRTGIRQAVKGFVDETVEPGAIMTAMGGEGVDASRRLIQALTGVTSEFNAARKQKVFADLARALTERQGDDALLALRAIDAAMKGQELTAKQTDDLARLLSGVFATSGGLTYSRGASAENRQAR